MDSPDIVAGSRPELIVNTQVEQAALDRALAQGVLLADRARRRPFYFDGRFLTALDLIADQDYTRARQSDLAQAMGAGIIGGLLVTLETDGTSRDPVLRVTRGSGITPSGELVVLANPQRIALAQLAGDRQLDAQLGIKEVAKAAAANRTGLFVLALRPIEYTANPVAAFPTSLDGTRSVHDGDIIEATAITLIPYPDRSGRETAGAKRARVAREIFFDRAQPGVLHDALPLAMLYLADGALQWLDVHMVRREIGAESTLTAGLAPRPRALLEAWLQQHLAQVGDLDEVRLNQEFPATRHFEVLPPVGLFPAPALRFDGSTLVQSFFPPLVDVEFAFVPTDEIAALVDESLSLPPIDLTASDEEIDHLSVLVLAPVTRQALASLKQRLATVRQPVRAAAPGMIAKRLPLDALLQTTRAQLPPLTLLPPNLVRGSLGEAELAQAWDAALKAAQNDAAQRPATQQKGCFWYVRRRQLPYTSEIASVTLRLGGDAAAIDAEMQRRLAADGTANDFDTNIAPKLPLLARAEAVNLLVAPRLDVRPPAAGVLPTSTLLRRSAYADLQAIAAAPPPAGADPTQATVHAAVLKLAQRFGDPRLGEGLEALWSAADADTRSRLDDPALQRLATAGVTPELDAALRRLPVDQAAALGKQLAAALGANDLAAVRALASPPPAPIPPSP